MKYTNAEEATRDTTLPKWCVDIIKSVARDTADREILRMISQTEEHQRRHPVMWALTGKKNES